MRLPLFLILAIAAGCSPTASSPSDETAAVPTQNAEEQKPSPEEEARKALRAAFNEANRTWESEKALLKRLKTDLRINHDVFEGQLGQATRLGALADEAYQPKQDKGTLTEDEKAEWEQAKKLSAATLEELKAKRDAKMDPIRAEIKQQRVKVEEAAKKREAAKAKLPK